MCAQRKKHLDTQGVCSAEPSESVASVRDDKRRSENGKEPHPASATDDAKYAFSRVLGDFDGSERARGRPLMDVQMLCQHMHPRRSLRGSFIGLRRHFLQWCDVDDAGWILLGRMSSARNVDRESNPPSPDSRKCDCREAQLTDTKKNDTHTHPWMRRSDDADGSNTRFTLQLLRKNMDIADTVQSLCQVIQSTVPLQLVKMRVMEVPLARVGICGCIHGPYTNPFVQERYGAKQVVITLCRIKLGEPRCQVM